MTTRPRLPSAARAGITLVTALLAIPGCSNDGVNRKTQEVVAPTIETFITDAPGIGKFKGFNEVYDIVQDTCLKRCNDEDNAPMVHSDESALSVQFISTASEIASNQTFTLDANVEMALYAGNVDVNASLKLANKTNFSRKAVRMMLVAHRFFKVAHNETMQIDSSKIDPDLLRRSKAASDADFDDRLIQFIGRCGSIYVKEQSEGAYLFALYEFTSEDSSKLTGLEAKLGGAFHSHVGKIGGGVQVGFQAELNQALSSVQWSVQVFAKGFKVNGQDGAGEGKLALEQNGQGGLDLQRIIGFFDAMQQSVGDDMQAIQTGDDRHPLSVFPLGVIAGYYPVLLSNVPANEVIQARSRMSDIQDAHDRMMQTYGGLATGLVNGRDEVRAFLARPADEQAKHQVMKWQGKPYTPAEKLRDNGKGLLDRVAPFGTSLDPRGGGGAASAFARRILDCWRWGRSGDLKKCLPDINKPVEAATGHPTFAAALAVLQSYNDTGRPVWLDYWWPTSPNPVKRKDASCAHGGHLPSVDESTAMGLVAWHRVPTSFPGRTSFWLAAATPGCTGGGWPYEFRYHDGTQAYLYGCANDGHSDIQVCVAGAGLFPATLPRLYPAGGF
jgi:hypothetical protein